MPKKFERLYKFYPQGITNYAGYMDEEEALKWLKEASEDKTKQIRGFEVVEEMTREQAIAYLKSFNNAVE